ncbi:hypothetical protein E8P77_02720 [Soehngenia saccharolytica]|nr:hypothetical protein E8P77_02720 [Soehngenia saccharolytica]
MVLYIKTFGDFDILDEGTSRIENLKRSYKLMKLLQYFIAFRNQKILTETIYETLWGEYDSMDVKNVIKGQIFRLKKGLKEARIDEDSLTIEFVKGYYMLKSGENVVIDSDTFEKYISEANMITENFEKALELYNKAFSIYENQLLNNIGYEIWLVPMRNYLRKLYVNSVEKIILQYQLQDKDDDIINICQRALSKEPYEEKFHRYLIQSLINEGKIQAAVEHVKYLQNEFVKGTGVFTIDSINRLENLLNANKKNTYIDNGIEKLQPLEGPMQLTEEEFKTVYQIAKRKRKSDEEADYLFIIELADWNRYSLKQIAWHEYVANVVTRSFRKSDCFAIWKGKEILVLLSAVKIDASAKMENRFFINYYETDSSRALPIKLRSIQIDENTKIKL